MTLITLEAFSQVPPHRRPGYCPLTKSIECEQFIKGKVSRYDFDEESELMELYRKCGGNPKDDCLKEAEDILPWYNMNDKEDLLAIASSCQLTNMECFSYVKSKLSRIDLNGLDDFRELARSCTRSDINCIKDLCSTRDYNCKRGQEVLRAAKRCYRPCRNN